MVFVLTHEAVLPPFSPAHCRFRWVAVSVDSLNVPAVHPLVVDDAGWVAYESGYDLQTPSILVVVDFFVAAQVAVVHPLIPTHCHFRCVVVSVDSLNVPTTHPLVVDDAGWVVYEPAKAEHEPLLPTEVVTHCPPSNPTASQFPACVEHVPSSVTIQSPIHLSGEYRDCHNSFRSPHTSCMVSSVHGWPLLTVYLLQRGFASFTSQSSWVEHDCHAFPWLVHAFPEAHCASLVQGVPVVAHSYVVIGQSRSSVQVTEVALLQYHANTEALIPLKTETISIATTRLLVTRVERDIMIFMSIKGKI